MRTMIHSCHFSDADGMPQGGQTYGNGFAIAWQNGPLERGAEPNGAFVEDILSAVQDRLEYYQGSPFECQENADAIKHISRALSSLESRTRRREASGVEGSHKGS